MHRITAGTQQANKKFAKGSLIKEDKIVHIDRNLLKGIASLKNVEEKLDTVPTVVEGTYS